MQEGIRQGLCQFAVPLSGRIILYRVKPTHIEYTLMDYSVQILLTHT